MDDRWKLQKRLQELREAKGWSLREAAKRITELGTKINHVRLGDFERGTGHTSGRPAHPDRDALIGIARAYGASADELLTLGGFLPTVFANELSRDEGEVVEILRALTPERREVLLKIARTLRD